MICYRNKTFAVGAVTLLAAAGLIRADDFPIYRLPDTWKGTKSGSAALASGDSPWQLSHIWPDNWRSLANYHPLEWQGGRWGLLRNAPGEHQKRPQATISNGSITLEGFASRQGTDTDRFPFSNKVPTLEFVSPSLGMYAISFEATFKSTAQQVGGHFILLKARNLSSRVSRLADLPIVTNDVLRANQIRIKLDSAERLILVTFLDDDRVGYQLVVNNMTVQRVSD